jgi:Lysylphosphatidylglycerol synthase TM region
VQDHRFLVHANHRLVFRERLFLHRQHLFHARDVFLIQFRHARHFFPPRLQVVAFEQDPDCLPSHPWHTSEHGSESVVRGGLSRFASRFACGLRDIGASYRLYLAALLSGSMLACQALALWFMMLACRIDLPLGACTVVFLVVRLGTALPNAPANGGSFQFFSVLALSLFGVEKTVAAGFSIIYFLALTVPLWIIGLLAISCTGMSLSTIRLGASALRRDAGGA